MSKVKNNQRDMSTNSIKTLSRMIANEKARINELSSQICCENLKNKSNPDEIKEIITLARLSKQALEGRIDFNYIDKETHYQLVVMDGDIVTPSKTQRHIIDSLSVYINLCDNDNHFDKNMINVAYRLYDIDTYKDEVVVGHNRLDELDADKYEKFISEAKDKYREQIYDRLLNKHMSVCTLRKGLEDKLDDIQEQQEMPDLDRDER